jgi:hypothetical protein
VLARFRIRPRSRAKCSSPGPRYPSAKGRLV